MKYPQIYIGKIEPYNGSSPSAIGKRQVQGGIMLTALGLEGDEQAETLSTAGQTAPYAIIHENTTPTG